MSDSIPFRPENDGSQPAEPLLSEGEIATSRQDKDGNSTSVREFSTFEVEENQGLRRRVRPSNESPSHTFLRSVGLKVLSSGERLKRHRKLHPTEEQPKVVESQSLVIAITRIGAHLLPILITVFLLLFNAIGFLNGPAITTPAEFALQVASKLHELAIVGSLTLIAVDLVRYYLLHGGVTLGLISAGQGFASLNWLWSTDFISGFRAAMPLRSKIYLLVTLVVCSILASVVGPASALLFLPTQLWLPAASTDFYLAGTENELYPLKLTLNNTGPAYCKASPLRLEDHCIHSGWRTLYAEMETLGPVRPGWSLLMPDKSSRTINGVVETDLETWAVTMTTAMAKHMDNLATLNGIAWSFAKGRNRRLRDFVGDGGGYAVVWGKMPVTRTVCGNLTLVRSDIRKVNDTTNKLGFPVLSRDQYWRTPESPGLVQEVDVSTLNLTSGWNGLRPLNLSHQQARAEWVPLPSSFGNSTSAGLIFMTQNASSAYARGCVVDARWAEGQNLRKALPAFWSMEGQVGKEPAPTGDSFSFVRGEYLDDKYKPFYGPTIEITKEWFNNVVLPMPEQTAVGSDFTQTLFEALLNSSILAWPGYSEGNTDDSRVLLEYFSTLFITDAISRIGYAQQMETPTSANLMPAIGSPPITSDLFLNGGPIFKEPDFPHIKAHYETYKYGTAWYLSSNGQFISVGIFAIYMVVALAHAAVVVWTRRSSDAWDSANELVALAYNSQPSPDALENCSSGITQMGTLQKMVRVAFMADEKGGKKVELVVAGEEQQRRVEGRIVPGEKYS